MAKAAFWPAPDTKMRKRGERTELDTGSPRCKRWVLGIGGIDPVGAEANALSTPPGDYGRKVKTQRN